MMQSDIGNGVQSSSVTLSEIDMRLKLTQLESDNARMQHAMRRMDEELFETKMVISLAETEARQDGEKEVRRVKSELTFAQNELAQTKKLFTSARDDAASWRAEAEAARGQGGDHPPPPSQTQQQQLGSGSGSGPGTGTGSQSNGIGAGAGAGAGVGGGSSSSRGSSSFTPSQTSDRGVESMNNNHNTKRRRVAPFTEANGAGGVETGAGHSSAAPAAVVAVPGAFGLLHRAVVDSLTTSSSSSSSASASATAATPSSQSHGASVSMLTGGQQPLTHTNASFASAVALRTVAASVATLLPLLHRLVLDIRDHGYEVERRLMTELLQRRADARKATASSCGSGNGGSGSGSAGGGVGADVPPSSRRRSTRRSLAGGPISSTTSGGAGIVSVDTSKPPPPISPQPAGTGSNRPPSDEGDGGLPSVRDNMQALSLRLAPSLAQLYRLLEQAQLGAALPLLPTVRQLCLLCADLVASPTPMPVPESSTEAAARATGEPFSDTDDEAVAPPAFLAALPFALYCLGSTLACVAPPLSAAEVGRNSSSSSSSSSSGGGAAAMAGRAHVFTHSYASTDHHPADSEKGERESRWGLCVEVVALVDRVLRCAHKAGAMGPTAIHAAEVGGDVITDAWTRSAANAASLLSVVCAAVPRARRAELLYPLLGESGSADRASSGGGGSGSSASGREGRALRGSGEKKAPGTSSAGKRRRGGSRGSGGHTASAAMDLGVGENADRVGDLPTKGPELIPSPPNPHTPHRCRSKGAAGTDTGAGASAGRGPSVLLAVALAPALPVAVRTEVLECLGGAVGDPHFFALFAVKQAAGEWCGSRSMSPRRDLWNVPSSQHHHHPSSSGLSADRSNHGSGLSGTGTGTGSGPSTTQYWNLSGAGVAVEGTGDFCQLLVQGLSPPGLARPTSVVGAGDTHLYVGGAGGPGAMGGGPRAVDALRLALASVHFLLHMLSAHGRAALEVVWPEVRSWGGDHDTAHAGGDTEEAAAQHFHPSPFARNLVMAWSLLVKQFDAAPLDLPPPPSPWLTVARLMHAQGRLLQLIVSLSPLSFVDLTEDFFVLSTLHRVFHWMPVHPAVAEQRVFVQALVDSLNDE